MNRLKYVLLVLTLGIIAILYTHPVGDTDVFWHLKTGEWIVKNLSIPSRDPFSFTTYENLREDEESRIRYILSQYWLSQVLFYLAFMTAGIKGIIILRMLLLVSILFIIWHSLNKRGLNIRLILPFIILSGIHLARYSTDRPQLFSFFFTALLIHELEDLLNNKKRTFFTIPLINLFWANMHASALMGLFIESAYLFGLFVEQNKDKAHRYYQGGIIVLGILSILINPNSYHVIPLLIKDLSKPALHFRFNTEYVSILEQLKEGSVNPEYLLCLLIGGISIFFKNTGITKRLIISFLLTISLYALRFAPFFTISVSIFCPEGLQKLKAQKARVFLENSLLALAIMLLSLTFFIHRDELLKPKIKDIYPEGAVEFLSKNNLSQVRLLNYFEWGGYLLWRSPELKTFIDGRVLRFSVWEDYFRTVMKPDAFWHDRLNQYRINLILLPLTRPEDGWPLNIMLLLLGHPEWKPIYADKLSVIFARKDMTLKEVPVEYVRSLLIEGLRSWAEKEPEDPKRIEVIEMYRH